MTREETIKWLKSLKAEIGKSEHRTLWHYAEAIDMAIEVLQADNDELSATKTEKSSNCGDLISRADAIKAVRYLIYDRQEKGAKPFKWWFIKQRLNAIPSAEAVKVAYICDGRKCDGDCSDCFRTLDIEHAKDFKLMGSVYYQQESADRPIGEWVTRENGNIECSLCGREKQDGWDYFCGSCGAKMRNNK